ncbi:zinc finger and BTB domain-containing protein 14 isoform X2 [Eurytemora carolleeae]|uniref:zinc finger and BTB domain-containing protein 14 isoform X2 n=1 Tax=Eurytemora carolleeae TaxID=1294199 RepID=UPI000C78209F|nr:zinc finger and BTB domain-containing protein 14 isoform X2 [Eurytemora carolleeae]|eukprot:XP_023340263.1 zinc finger and BTB domain-containing protein 14-like isoform X2 [Eurytemora affinis]
MGSSEKFCLRWNDFESNISVAFRELREEKDFFDVTLACDDSQLQAHKVILSACSPFFRNILRKNPHQHPLLYLKGVKYKELVSVLNFMYMGEVNVAQEELNSFLSVAEELRVKGLTQNNSSDSAKPEPKSRSRDPPETAPPAKKNRPSVPPPTPSQDDDIQEVIPVKSEPRDQPVPVSQELNHGYQDTGDQGTVALQENYPDDYDYEGYEGYDEGSYDPSTMQATGADGNKGRQGKEPIVGNGLEGMDWKQETMDRMRKGDGGNWFCCECNYMSKVKNLLLSHVQSQHLPGFPGYTCALCSAHSTTYSGLEKHTSRQHSISLAKMKTMETSFQ